jgi:hypothetical protein
MSILIFFFKVNLLQEQHVVLDLKQEIFLINFHNQLTYKMVFDIFHVKHVHVIPTNIY